MSVQDYMFIEKRIGEKKNTRVAVPDTAFDLLLCDYKIYTAKNVLSISMKDQSQLGWDVEYLELEETGQPDYYFYFDCEQSDAFGHWVFESAYFIPLFKVLQDSYPSIKLLSFKEKNYMNCMYKACNIKDSEVAHQITNPHNIVFFPECSNLSIHTNRKEFMHYIQSFYNLITKDLPPVIKTTRVMYLPRGSRENFKPNDRTIPCQEQLVELLPHVFSESKVYFTDKVTNLKDQIEQVRSAELLIVDYGSNLMFNGYFGERSKVLVIGNTHRHTENPRPYDLILDSEARGVRYYYLPGSVSAMEVLQAVQCLLSQDIPSFQHQLRCWRQCSLCLTSDTNSLTN